MLPFSHNSDTLTQEIIEHLPGENHALRQGNTLSHDRKRTQLYYLSHSQATVARVKPVLITELNSGEGLVTLEQVPVTTTVPL